MRISNRVSETNLNIELEALSNNTHGIWHTQIKQKDGTPLHMGIWNTQIMQKDGTRGRQEGSAVGTNPQQGQHSTGIYKIYFQKWFFKSYLRKCFQTKPCFLKFLQLFLNFPNDQHHKSPTFNLLFQPP